MCPVSSTRPSERSIGPAHQLIDLLRRLDVAAAVRMKHGAQAGFVADRARHAFGARREGGPGRLLQAVLGGDAAGIALALGHARVVVRQHDERAARAGIAHQPRGPHRRGHAVVVRGRVGQRHRHEGADQLQLARGQLVAEPRRIGRHEAPVAQLGSRVSGLLDLVEHRAVRRRDGLTVEFEDSPGARSVGDANHRRMILSARLAPRVLFRSSPPSPGRTGTTVEITRARAGWHYVHFAVRQIAPGKAVGARHRRGRVLPRAARGALPGFVPRRRAPIEAARPTDPTTLGPRRDVFADYPHALYLPARTSFRVDADVATELADGRAPSRKRLDPRHIRPEDCGFEIRGGGNATRQIVDIMPPAFPADRLLVCEVFTPAGNWSSYPPHKHDQDRPPAEVKLEEIYYYRFEHPDAYGFQRLYDGRTDRTVTVAPRRRRDGAIRLSPVRHGVRI